MPILLSAVKSPEHEHIAPCLTICVEQRESEVFLAQPSSQNAR